MNRTLLKFSLVGSALVAASYSIWLIFAVLWSLGLGGEAGMGIFLLVYAALPATVASVSLLRYLVLLGDRKPLRALLASAACVLALAQLAWILDLAVRIRLSADPLVFALSTTVLTIAVAVLNLRATAPFGRRGSGRQPAGVTN
jgi:hypothetical protein